ncbi:glycosyltransferase [Psychromonas sp. KJ10-10]|uniref:glycosyltransferase n=1 Tax=Psychromonas sp. KJ10-10 TaxID=3391823 RepID=UPI0039B3C2BF
MKVLYISSRAPFPKTGGREFMIAQSLSFLVSEFDTHLICFHGKNDSFNQKEIKNLGLMSVNYILVPSAINLFRNIVVRKRASLQEHLYFSNKNLSIIEQHIDNISPDVIICDMLRTSQYIRMRNKPLIIDLDDILSNRYEKMLQGNSNHSVLGTYTDRLPQFMGAVESWFRKSILNHEKIRIKEAERNAVSQANKLISTSEKEASILSETYSTDKVVGIPQAIDYVHKTYTNITTHIDLIFVGNLTTAQNIESVRFIVNDVFEELDLLNLEFKLKVIGKYDHRVEKIIANFSQRVELLGFVDDMASVVSKNSIAIATVAFGTGIKTKVLDSIALGIPTVTNTVGSEGLNLVNGVHAIVENAPSAIAFQIRKVFYCHKFARNLSQMASKYLIQNHSVDLLKARYIQLVREAQLDFKTSNE